MKETNYQKVCNFHKKYKILLNEKNIPEKDLLFRAGLIQEELDEFKEAIEKKDKLKMLDAIADMLYVVYGAGVEHGFDIDEAFDRIHQSNMSKDALPENNYKPVKGKKYFPPKLDDLIEDKER